MKIRYVAFAAFLAAGPLTVALAQTASPPAGAGDTKEDRAARDGSVTDQPGATGKTVVPGSNSTIAKDKPATAETRTGTTGSGAGGK
jgi:hypothetical protein